MTVQAINTINLMPAAPVAPRYFVELCVGPNTFEAGDMNWHEAIAEAKRLVSSSCQLADSLPLNIFLDALQPHQDFDVSIGDVNLMIDLDDE